MSYFFDILGEVVLLKVGKRNTDLIKLLKLSILVFWVQLGILFVYWLLAGNLETLLMYYTHTNKQMHASQGSYFH